MTDNVGKYCHDLALELWPICRSLTGPGVRETLARLKDEMPELRVESVPSGTQAFDWVVPDEWTIREAYVADESGRRIIDFKDNNLHVVGYSIAVDGWFDLEELQNHLYSIPEKPDLIPYITSYYKQRWGFCLSETQRQALEPGRYRVVIDATLAPGVLNYGELILPGESDEEVFLSTYICHPSMANNELSGPVVTTAIARWLRALEKRHYTYRIVFIPETIGSIVYLSRNPDQMKRRVVAGFNISCIGDDRSYSYLPSRAGDTWSDQVAKHVLHFIDPSYAKYSWLDRGSDERQYCAPGVDLPVASIMRSKYAEYPEYHTSADDLENVVTPTGLGGGYTALQQAIRVIEEDYFPEILVYGEPQLGKRGLYPEMAGSRSPDAMLNMISYCDGTKSLAEIGDIIGVSFFDLVELAAPLAENGLLAIHRSRQ